jgi:hypothetical protein
MSVNPSPLRPAALACPICGEPIAVFEALDRTYPEEQRVQATEALILHHVQIQHTMHDVLAALGIARNALMDIAPLADDLAAASQTAAAKAIDEAVERGLGHV